MLPTVVLCLAAALVRGSGDARDAAAVAREQDSRQLLDALAPGELAHHLPSFPIPVRLPIGLEGVRFLYFPRDSAADHEGSVRRCQALKAALWVPRAINDREIGDEALKMLNVEREMLSCMIDGPVFVAPSEDLDGSDECQVLMPGGIMVRSSELCRRQFGSLCRLDGQRFP